MKGQVERAEKISVVFHVGVVVLEVGDQVNELVGREIGVGGEFRLVLTGADGESAGEAVVDGAIVVRGPVALYENRHRLGEGELMTAGFRMVDGASDEACRLLAGWAGGFLVSDLVGSKEEFAGGSAEVAIAVSDRNV